jgi:hypothetical protein
MGLWEEDVWCSSQSECLAGLISSSDISSLDGLSGMSKGHKKELWGVAQALCVFLQDAVLRGESVIVSL